MSKQPKKLLSNLKRGLASLFVFAAVLFPIYSLVQLAGGIRIGDSRKANALPSFVDRQMDVTSGPLRPFDEPIITITFDDGWESIYETAIPLMQQYGIHSTQYLLSGTLKNPAYMSLNQIKNLHDSGQEVACHGVNHPDLTTLSPTAQYQELQTCKDYFTEHVSSISDFASPFGHTDSRTIEAIKSVYRSHRNTNGDIGNGVNEQDVNIRNYFDPYNIISYAIRSDTDLEDIKKAVEYTIKHNGWLVLTYHQADDNGTETFGLDAASLKKQLSYLSHSKVRIAPIGAVMSAIDNQVEY